MQDQSKKRPRRKLKIFLASLALLALVVAGAVATLVFWRGNEGDTYLSDIVANTLSSDGNKVEIGSVEGALSSHLVLRNLTMTDKAGVWLKLDRAELVWNRSALLTGKLSVDLLALDVVDVLRMPQIDARATPQQTPVEEGSGIPDLPVKIVVRSFQLKEARLAEPLAGVPARLTANGQVELGDPSEGLKLNFTLKRLDAAGMVGVNMSFVPDTQALSLDITHDEPAGGLVARLMHLDDLPPVQFTVHGRGVLDDFKATMNYTAGEKLGANGTATLQRFGAARRFDMQADARIESMLPHPVSLLVAGVTRIQGQALFGDDKSLTIPGFSITSALAEFKFVGAVAPDKTLDLTLTAAAIRGQDGRTRAAGGELERLALTTTVTGAATAPVINAKLDVGGLVTPQGRLASGLLTATAAPQGKTWNVQADAAFTGMATTERKWADAAGGSLTLALKATRQEDGNFNIRQFDVSTPTAHADYQGMISPKSADGLLKVALKDFSAFSGIANRRLRGAANVDMRLSGAFDTALVAEIDGKARGLFFDTPPLDGLMQGNAALNGRTTFTRDSATFDNLRFDAGEMHAIVNGVLDREKADTRLSFNINDLSKADARLKGKLMAEGALTGASQSPDVALTLRTENAVAMEQPVRQFELAVLGKDVLGALEGRLDLKGEVGSRPLTGAMHVQRLDADGWLMDKADFQFGSAMAAGRLSTKGGLADGKLTVRADRLADLSVLALSKLSGSFSADLTLSADNAQQGGHLVAKGRDIVAGTMSAKVLDADLTGSDVLRNPVLNGFLTGSGWTVADEKIETVSLKAQGDARGSAIALQVAAQGLAINGHANVVSAADVIRVALSDFSVRRGQKGLSLVSPVMVSVQNGVVNIPALAIGANGGGRVTASGALASGVGKSSDLTVNLERFPLAVATLVKPALDLAGTLDGQVKITGDLGKPHGQYALDIRGAATPDSRQAGLPGIDVSAKGQLNGDDTTFDATVIGGRLGRLTVHGSAPFRSAGKLSVKAQGQLDLAAANGILAAGGQQVGGKVDLDASVGGTVDKPLISGTAVLAGVSFIDPLQGVKLTNIQGRVTGQGDALVIERITAMTPNQGTITVSGRVEADPAKGFPGALRIDANRAELVSSTLVTAVSNMALTMSGPLAQRPQISGRIDLVKMEVSIPNRLPTTAQPLPGAKHIAPPAQVKAHLEAQRKAQRKAARTAPFDAALDIAVSAPNQIFIRGQGVDAEVGGALRITGSSRDPKVIGGFDMRRGRLTIIGQRLDFTRGKLSFTGDLTPDLDFLAQSQAGDVTAKVAVTGPANQPSFELSSTPELPRDEVLSRLLFEKSSGSLSAFQALQLAQAVAQLSGNGGPDVFDQARKALGLDSLDITTGTSGGPAVGASRYINDRISVGVRAGANPEDNAATVNIDVTKRLKFQGEVGPTGNTSVGVGAEWEY